MSNSEIKAIFNTNILTLKQHIDGTYTLSFRTPPFVSNSISAIPGSTRTNDSFVIKNNTIQRTETYFDNIAYNNKKISQQTLQKYSQGLLGSDPIDEDYYYTISSEYNLPQNIVSINCTDIPFDVSVTIYDQPHHNCAYIGSKESNDIVIHFPEHNGHDTLEKSDSCSIYISYPKSNVTLTLGNDYINNTSLFTITATQHPHDARIIFKERNFIPLDTIKGFAPIKNTGINFINHESLTPGEILSSKRVISRFYSTVISRKQFANIPDTKKREISNQAQEALAHLTEKKCPFPVAQLSHYIVPCLDNTKPTYPFTFTVEIENIPGSEKIRPVIFTRFGFVDIKHYYSQRKNWYNIYNNTTKQGVVVSGSDYENILLLDMRSEAEKDTINPQIQVSAAIEALATNPESTHVILEKTDSKTNKTYREMVYIPIYANDIFEKTNNKYGFTKKDFSTLGISSKLIK